MAVYQSDGKKLIDVEYDAVVEVGDVVDGMRVLSTHAKNSEEYCVFLLEPVSRRIVCYIFDEIFIIGKSDEFDDLSEAVEAWKNDEI
jgi:hypothetical protein